MWYLTILYLYVNINTCCCITNGIKKGWLKCWMSENSACVDRVLQGAGALQEHVSDGAGCARQDMEQEQGTSWHPLFLLCASTGNLPPCVTSQVHRVTPAAAAPPAALAHRAASSLLSPLCLSPCSSCALQQLWREQKLQPGCFPGQGVSWWGSAHPVSPC